MTEYYYVVKVDGLPEYITKFYNLALQKRDELNTAARKAEVVPVKEVTGQLELE